jgi:hypothetical protein
LVLLMSNRQVDNKALCTQYVVYRKYTVCAQNRSYRLLRDCINAANFVVRISTPMKLKARGLAQHGGPPGWLEESDPTGWDFVRDGRSMLPSLTDYTTCPGLGLIYSVVLNVHKTPS